MTTIPRKDEDKIHMIPIDQIIVLDSPGKRRDDILGELVSSIKEIGLKKPITVTPCNEDNPSEGYFLMCGERRLRAFKILGKSHIPAEIFKVSVDEEFIKALTGTIPRRGNILPH